jgi:DNA-binding protein H-NS
MAIPMAPLLATAQESVREHLKLGALENGTPTGKKKPAPKQAAKKPPKVLPKYRDAATGQTWSGRGLQPKWLKVAMAAGRQLSEFLI